MEESVRPILDESSAYYLLGFQTSDVKPDGRFHLITVKVNRPDVQVRTRKGYYADAVTAAGHATEGAGSLEAVSGGLLPVGYLLGGLFVALGAGRLTLARRSG